MQKRHGNSAFPWWLGLPGILIVVLAAFGLVQEHPYWTLLIIALSVVGYVIFLRRMAKASRGEDPEE
jgi:lipoprotein signal peptidase